MRHRYGYKKLGRYKEHRMAMLRNLAKALLTHGRIETTLARAKALSRVLSKYITLAKKAAALEDDDPKQVHYRRMAYAFLQDRELVRRLFNEIGTMLANRQPSDAGGKGGYFRIVKLGRRRGDAAEMAIIERV